MEAVKQACRQLVQLHEQIARKREALKEMTRDVAAQIKHDKEVYGDLLNTVGEYMQANHVPVFQAQNHRISLFQRKSTAPLTPELLAEATSAFIASQGPVTSTSMQQFFEHLQQRRMIQEPRVTVRKIAAPGVKKQPIDADVA